LGSIEYLIDRNVGMPIDLFRVTEKTMRVSGKSAEEVHIAALPDIDLCVMNPPFTRSVGGNLLFGSLPESERKACQKRLQKIVRARNAPANITAGLGSVFVAMANTYIKPGGRLSLVLPKTLLSGVAWSKTRDVLRKQYVVEYIISSHDPQRWNFSESTSLSEVLIVARKLCDGEKPNDCDPYVTAVNLTRNPTTLFEAHAIGHEILRDSPPAIEDAQGAIWLKVGDHAVAEAVSIGWQNLRSM
jgi:hypothetical protein